MNLTRHLSLLIHAESYAWLLVLVALYVGGSRREVRSRNGGLRTARVDEAPPNYRALTVFAMTRFLTTLLYPIFVEWQLQIGLNPLVMRLLYYWLYWTFYLVGTIALFFFIEALIKNSLKPLPGLSSAAVLVFRWASSLSFVLALTAHIPVLGKLPLHFLIDEVNYSFVVCVCSFELTLVVLLLTQLQRLGMCLRSRPVGLGIGLTIIGCMDLASAAMQGLSPSSTNWFLTVNEITDLAALAIWMYYIILPEPLRNPHSLSPASRLMKWNEIALKLELNGKQAETVPFISGVESVVVGIMKKHNIGNNS